VYESPPIAALPVGYVWSSARTRGVKGVTRLTFFDEGDGDPLVLIHAGIADARMWLPQADRFAGERRVVRPDLRGFGGTAHSRDAYRHAADLADLFDDLEVSPAVVVGASMGGAVAIDLALERPDLVRGLVLVGSTYDGFRFLDRDLLDRWSVLTDIYEAGRLDEAAVVETGIWLGPGTSPDTTRAVVEMVRLSYDHGEIEEREIDPPASERLGELEMPTLIVLGAEDRPDIHRSADELVNSIPHARMVTMPGATHLPSLEQPDVFNNVLVDFIASLN
jgi:pimeloyl-ACP methyl ester carboxylesterase